MKRLAMILAFAFTMGLATTSVNASNKEKAPKKVETKTCTATDKKACCASTDKKACCTKDAQCAAPAAEPTAK